MTLKNSGLEIGRSIKNEPVYYYHLPLTMSRSRYQKLSLFNDISNYEEHVEVEGLTLWDLNRPVYVQTQTRTPVPVAASSSSSSSHDQQKDTIASGITAINSRLLSEFNCPICLSVLHETSTVMECMHRFCSEW